MFDYYWLQFHDQNGQQPKSLPQFEYGKGKTSNDNIAGNAISFNKSSESSESNHIAIRF